MKPYSMPTRVQFGCGSFARIGESPALVTARTIALFTGKQSLRATGIMDRLSGMLGDRRLDFFEPIPAEPQIADLEHATTWLQQHESDAVLAIGGGSVLDIGKAAAFCAHQKESPRAILKAMPDKARAPLPTVAVPTTAGSGSEVTPFAVLWDREAGKKYSLDHPFLFPAEAIVDAELTCSLPPALTASMGLDAFTHACEAYWNRNANPVSDRYALQAIERIRSALPRVVHCGEDREARTEMMRGSLDAGLAFSNTRTGACHSISYPLTLRFGVRHGQAVAITLPEVLPLNMSATMDGATGLDRKTAEERCHVFFGAMGVRSISETSSAVRDLMAKSGLETRLSRLNIDRAGIETIVAEGFTPARMTNNPYPFTARTLRNLLWSIL